MEKRANMKKDAWVWALTCVCVVGLLVSIVLTRVYVKPVKVSACADTKRPQPSVAKDGVMTNGPVRVDAAGMCVEDTDAALAVCLTQREWNGYEAGRCILEDEAVVPCERRLCDAPYCGGSAPLFRQRTGVDGVCVNPSSASVGVACASAGFTWNNEKCVDTAMGELALGTVTASPTHLSGKLADARALVLSYVVNDTWYGYAMTDDTGMFEIFFNGGVGVSVSVRLTLGNNVWSGDVAVVVGPTAPDVDVSLNVRFDAAVARAHVEDADFIMRHAGRVNGKLMETPSSCPEAVVALVWQGTPLVNLNLLNTQLVVFGWVSSRDAERCEVTKRVLAGDTFALGKCEIDGCVDWIRVGETCEYSIVTYRGQVRSEPVRLCVKGLPFPWSVCSEIPAPLAGLLPPTMWDSPDGCVWESGVQAAADAYCRVNNGSDMLSTLQNTCARLSPSYPYLACGPSTRKVKCDQRVLLGEEDVVDNLGIREGSMTDWASKHGLSAPPSGVAPSCGPLEDASTWGTDVGKCKPGDAACSILATAAGGKSCEPWQISTDSKNTYEQTCK